MDPVDIIGGFYTDESLPWSCQDTVNYIPVRAEVAGTRTPTKLVDAPGMKPFLWVGHYAEDAVPSGPIRGMHDVEGKLFIVCGTTLYRINNKDVAIPLGTVPGTGRVSMAHNQITGGNQLIVVNGSSGYVYNTVSEVFERVVDASYPGAAIVEFIDGYLMQLEPFGRFLLFSDLADALAYNALDRFEAETAPDMTVGIAIVHQEVWALGERSIDVFENVGTAQGTFRNKGVSIQKGCGARWSTAPIDNGLAWLGSDGVIYHARSYDPVRISTRAVEVALAECSPADRKNAFAMVWEDRGHAVYYITVPNGPTFGYDFSTGLWHRRASYSEVTDVSGRWRLNDLVRSNSRWIGGDYQDGRLYTLDWDYMLEGVDTPHVRERTSPAAHNNQNRFTVDHVEIIFDTGGPETVPVPFPYQPVGPQMSGEAPDGVAGTAQDAFTYTITQGGAPISKVEILAGSLPAGLEWDEATGTISAGTPSAAGVYSLTFKVVDANGLFAIHTDSFQISLDLTPLATLAGDAIILAWSPDSSYLAIGYAADPYLRIYKRTGDVVEEIEDIDTALGGRPHGLAWDPTSTYLAVASEGGDPARILKRTDDDFADLLTLVGQPDWQERGLAWKPDGSHIALVNSGDVIFGAPAQLAVWSWSPGTETATKLFEQSLPKDPFDKDECQYSPDGSLLAIGLDGSPSIILLNATGSASYSSGPSPLPLPHSSATEPRFSIDGNYLAMSHATAPFFSVYEKRGAAWVRLDTPDGSCGGDATAWHPGGGLLAIGGTLQNLVEIWSRVGDDFSLASSISVHTQSVGFSPDGECFSTGAAVYKVAL